MPVPESWQAMAAQELFFYRNYSPELQSRFWFMLNVFAREKHFFGAGGLEIRDEHRVVISGCAVRLVLFLGISAYDRLTEIVVYPRAFRRPQEKEIYLGEAHHWGTVVLSWPAVLEGLRRPCDGHDTALHEFAHVLDRASGEFDGTPVLRSRADYLRWGEVFSAAFQRLRQGGWKERSVLREYGAENEAEFFAVSVEAFFERPGLMRRMLPEMYQELRRYFGFDPAEDPRCAGLDPGREIEKYPAPGGATDV